MKQEKHIKQETRETYNYRKQEKHTEWTQTVQEKKGNIQNGHIQYRKQGKHTEWTHTVQETKETYRMDTYSIGNKSNIQSRKQEKNIKEGNMQSRKQEKHIKQGNILSRKHTLY